MASLSSLGSALSPLTHTSPRREKAALSLSPVQALSAARDDAVKKSPRFKLDKLAALATATVLDPFAEEERRLALNLREGLGTLLDMHTPAELGSLCGALGLVRECEFGSPDEKKHGLLLHVADEGVRIGAGRAILATLQVVWDGILFEYLRSEGQPVRSARVDPRTFVLALWRQRAFSASGGAGDFRPMYVPRHVASRLAQPARAADLEGLLRGVEQRELAVKHIEKKVRTQADYRHVLRLLGDTAALHEFERDARDYLMHELEAARGRGEHYAFSLGLASEQLGELERRHDVITSQLIVSLSRSDAEVSFHMNATDTATDAEHLVNLLRLFLATPGPADGSMRLHYQLPSMDVDEAGEAEDASGDGETDGETAGQRDDGALSVEEASPEALAQRFVEGCVLQATALRLPARVERDASTLACLAFEKHAYDVAAVLDRAEASDAAFAATFASFQCARNDLNTETKRGDSSERRLRNALSLADALSQAAAQQAAAPLAELALWKTLALRSVAEAAEAQRRLALAAPVLLAMVASDGPTASIAAALAVALQVLPSREAALQVLDCSAMAREELAQRTLAALHAAPARASKKKGAKAKKSVKKDKQK
mmetsp:Transcript_21849/g.74059  ORF Transcript_21849/g.74059 Transcript_21849/m.74059 type:complete len:605 (+) Transcript_21849:229-2043(+)